MRTLPTSELTFTARGPDRYSVSSSEELSLLYRVVDLRLEDIEETLFAYLLSSLWSLEYRASIVAESASPGRHDRRSGQSFLSGV